MLQNQLPCSILFLLISSINIAFGQCFNNTTNPATYQTYTTGRAPTNVVVANLNADEFPDMAITNFLDNTLTIRFNDGSGHFDKVVTIAVGQTPKPIVALDLNNDGRIDLAVGNSAFGTVSVLLNSPNGITAVSATYEAVSDMGPLALSDFNADGRVDLAVPSEGDKQYRILVNNGDGTLTPQPIQAIASPGNCLTAADFDTDGYIDLAFTTSSHTVIIHKNLGNGQFMPTGTYAISTGAITISAGDLNSDGRIDLIAGTFNSNTVHILLNIGNGQFVTTPTIPNVSAPSAIVVQDVNSDGLSDVVIAHKLELFVSVWLGNDDGTFSTTRHFATGPGPSGLSLADINGDNQLDIITANIENSTVSVLINQGQGWFGEASALLVINAPRTPADINNDGLSDIITVANDPAFGLSSNVLCIYQNRGNNQFTEPTSYTVGSEIQTITAGDLNNDGWIDVVTNSYYHNSIAVSLNNGKGGFKQPVFYAVGPQTTQPMEPQLADINNDGQLDIVIVNNSSAYPKTFSVYINQGEGNLKSPVQYAFGDVDIDAYTISDLTGDGLPDVVVVGTNNQQTRLFLFNNQGNGLFGLPVISSIPKRIIQLIGTDFNTDGIKDLLVRTIDGIYVMYQQGNGNFDPATRVLSGSYQTMALGDIDDNGLIDLFAVNRYDNESSKSDIMVYANINSMTIPQPIVLRSGYFLDIKFGEFNGDKKPDILVSINKAPTFWYNCTTPQHWGIQTISSGSWSSPQTWSTERVPIETDHVLIRHFVTLPDNSTTKATRVGFMSTGQLQYGENSQLRIRN